MNPHRRPFASILLAGGLLAGAVSAQSAAPGGVARFDGDLVPAETWSFDETTTGNDINWVSPTTVEPDAVAYTADYELSDILVSVEFSGLPFGPFSVVDLVDPELLSETVTIDGPAPLTLLDFPVEFPAPPEPVSIAGTLSFGIDASGSGFFDFTDVVLGTFTIDLGFPFGEVTADITSVQIIGQLTVDWTQWKDLGNGLAGTGGLLPVLAGDGMLQGGDAYSVTLSDALPNTTFAFVLGFGELNLPFKGGVLVPTLDVLVFGLPTGPTGSLPLGGTWRAGVPTGTVLVFQYWITDPGGVFGFSATNGLSATAP